MTDFSKIVHCATVWLVASGIRLCYQRVSRACQWALPAVNRYCVAPEFLPEEKLRVERIFSCLQLGIVEGLRDGRLSAEIASRAESVLGQSSPASWRFGDIALCAFLCRHGRESELEIRELGSPLLWFEGDGLVVGLSEGEIEEVLSIEREIKRTFVEKLLDVFVNPQKHEHCGWTMRDVICREVFGSVPRAARD